MFCPNTAKLVAKLGTSEKNRLKFPFFIGSLSPTIRKMQLPSNLHFMLDFSLAIVEALVRFMEYQQWTRLAVITDLDSSYYFQTADTFLKYIKSHRNISISLYEQVGFHNSLNLGKSFDAKVVFVSASLKTLREVVKMAIENEWMWPTHAWIFHTHSIDDVTLVDKHTHFSINISSLNGVFFFQNSLLKNNPMVSIFEHLYPSIGSVCKANNPFSSILCRSAIISSVLKNMSSCSGNVTVDIFSSVERTLFGSGVDLLHISGGETYIVGHYNTQLESLNITNHSILLRSEIPPSTVYQLPSMLVLVVFCIEIIGSFVLVTVNLVFYICYRKEPEIKATSYMITMVIFVSCYILMLYLVLLASEHFHVMPTKTFFKDAVCLARSWINLIGVPGPVIVATVLIKMLRVCKIFRPNNFSRIGKFFSDRAILCYIFILQLPNTMVALLWSILDPYKNKIESTQKTNYIEVFDKCHSDNIATWPVVLLAYFIILAIALAIVAIKTRKIRKKHFKDTKKVNLFVYMIIFLAAFLVGFWITTRTVSNIFYAEVALHFGHTFMILITQCLLIVPKIYSPLRRHVQKVKLRTAIASTDSSAARATHEYYLYSSTQRFSGEQAVKAP